MGVDFVYQRYKKEACEVQSDCLEALLVKKAINELGPSSTDGDEDGLPVEDLFLGLSKLLIQGNSWSLLLF